MKNKDELCYLIMKTTQNGTTHEEDMDFKDHWLRIFTRKHLHFLNDVDLKKSESSKQFYKTFEMMFCPRSNHIQ